MGLGELFTSAVIHTVVGEAIKPTVQSVVRTPPSAANMGSLSGDVQPETLPRDSFLAGEPNYVCYAVWGVAAFFIAKYMKWL
jgi:hypothetical protein